MSVILSCICILFVNQSIVHRFGISFQERDIIRPNIIISKGEALKIAEKEARRLGYSLDSLDVKEFARPVAGDSLGWFADSLITIKRGDSSVSYPYFSQLSKEEEKGYAKKLGRYKYWLFYFRPSVAKRGGLYAGGDLWIFVDTHRGRVVLTIRGR